MHSFSPGFQLRQVGLGVRLAGVVERLDRPSADVAYRPDDSHPRPGCRLVAKGGLERGLEDALGFGCLLKAPALGRFSLGSQFVTIQCSSCHE